MGFFIEGENGKTGYVDNMGRMYYSDYRKRIDFDDYNKNYEMKKAELEESIEKQHYCNTQFLTADILEKFFVEAAYVPYAELLYWRMRDETYMAAHFSLDTATNNKAYIANIDEIVIREDGDAWNDNCLIYIDDFYLKTEESYYIESMNDVIQKHLRRFLYQIYKEEYTDAFEKHVEQTTNDGVINSNDAANELTAFYKDLGIKNDFARQGQYGKQLL